MIRRLIDATRREVDGGDGPATRKARAERAYRVMAGLAGDLPGYEGALRALFAGDVASFAANIADWPRDVAAYVQRLARLDDAG